VFFFFFLVISYSIPRAIFLFAFLKRKQTIKCGRKFMVDDKSFKEHDKDQ